MYPKIFSLLLFLSLYHCVSLIILDPQCHNIGSQTVDYDPACSSGESLGCNAGGQGINCRFCGFSPFNWPCKSSPTPPGPTPSNTVSFKITNNCPYIIYPGILGHSVLNPGWTVPNKGGFELKINENIILQIPTDFSGRFWARTGCKFINNDFVCDTGSCGPWIQCSFDGVARGGQPPATLAEFTLNGYGNQDYYDVSLVDGYNIQMTISPNSPSNGTGDYWCKKPGCSEDLNKICPNELKNINKDGNVVACQSACEKINTDEYCCRGAHGTPQTCVPDTWPINYSKIFKIACPTAYSYAYDDKTSTFFCRNTGYDITFC